MNLSETIVAAMIGAGATVATATFQLFLAFRSRKADSRPKRGSGLRSTLAVCGLVLGAAVAGFGYSELRIHREREESRAMEQRISDRLQALANMQLTQLRSAKADDAVVLPTANVTSAPARAEAMIHLPACDSQAPSHGGDPVGCGAKQTTRVALCASLPAGARVREVQLFAHPDGEPAHWETSRVAAEEDIRGARFVAGIYEIAQGSDHKAVCARFLQWSNERGHVARIVVDYSPAAATSAGVEPVPAETAVHLPEQAAEGENRAVAGNPVTVEIVPANPASDAAEAVVAAQP